MPPPQSIKAQEAHGPASATAACWWTSIRFSYAPYLRAVLFELEREIGVLAATNAPPLPRDVTFQAGTLADEHC